VLARRRDILASVPGIGPASIAALTAELPELGYIDEKKVAALAGVAPMDRASGTWQGRSQTRGGRRRLRAALHMAALAAARCNPDLKACPASKPPENPQELS
jgi:transposase